MAEFDLLRQMPHSQEAEQALLGAVLLNPEKFDEIVFLKPEYFFQEQHRQIYIAMLDMYNNNRSIEAVNLVDTLTKLNLYTDGSAFKYLKLLCDTASETLNVAECASIIRDKALLRALIEEIRDISEEAYSEVGGADAILAEAEKRIFAIAENKFDLSMARISDVLRSNLALLEQLSENPELLSGAKTQFEALDRLIVGMGKGDLVLIGGRPGMGKTSFAMNIAVNFAKATGEKVAVFSLEMSAEQIVNRMLSSEALVDGSSLRSGKMTTEEWKRIAAAASQLSGTQIERHNDNRVLEVADITRSLKILAKEFSCPIILCSQLSRNNESRSDKRPMLSDLRDSGAIEQDADIVLFIYRKNYYNDEGDKNLPDGPIMAECMVAKNRHGATGSAPLVWQGKNFRFFSVENKDENT